MEKKYAAPTTYGASKFEIMTDELHAKKIAVVETLEDAVLMAASSDLLDALYTALPYVEDAIEDPCYKKASVKDAVKKILAAIQKAEGKA